MRLPVSDADFSITANMDVNEDGFIQNWNPTLEDFQESES
jgi:hypothetical protein